MFRLLASSAFLASGLWASAASPLLEAPNPKATPANQLVVSGNACGPTALLNSFHFANPAWQRASNAISGETDKQRIYTIIREYGMRPSAHLKERPRWSKAGVNLADLCDIANEMTRGHFLPLVSQEVMFRKPGEISAKLLKRVHSRLGTSLEKGFPPLVSLRRFVKRGGSWVAIDAHFVTVTTIPRKLDKNASSFSISYVDPWGGKICQGNLAVPDRAILADAPADSPCLDADFPQASVGKRNVRKGEPTALTLAAVLGRW
jgi:hypothetical protein